MVVLLALYRNSKRSMQTDKLQVKRLYLQKNSLPQDVKLRLINKPLIASSLKTQMIQRPLKNLLHALLAGKPVR